MGCIYKITNAINNKVYIGKTEKTFEERWSRHIYNAFVLQLDYPLYRAFRKYDMENFYIDIIEDNISSSVINEREKYWIAYYNSYGTGYNATLGGDGNSLYNSEEIAKKYMELKNIDETAKFFNCSRRPVLEAIKKHNIQTNYKRKVCQIDKDTNEIINVFDSIREAAQIVFKDIEKSKNINAVCRGKGQTAYGYKWKYLEN